MQQQRCVERHCLVQHMALLYKSKSPVLEFIHGIYLISFHFSLSDECCLLNSDNLCKQFGPRSGQTGSKLFDTDGIKKIFFKS